jgi:hypothetical protein
MAHDLLAAGTGLGNDALLSALRSALAAGVLVTDPEGDYAFRHDLFREALLADLLPAERARAHRAFAEALEADSDLRSGQWSSLQLAVHWQGAGEDERALRAAWTAAAAAGQALAYAEQLQVLELVLQLWERAPDAVAGTAMDRADVEEMAAAAARLAGEPERGLALVDAAIGGVDRARDAADCFIAAAARCAASADAAARPARRLASGAKPGSAPHARQGGGARSARRGVVAAGPE